jgi:hypothetical protein
MGPATAPQLRYHQLGSVLGIVVKPLLLLALLSPK